MHVRKLTLSRIGKNHAAGKNKMNTTYSHISATEAADYIGKTAVENATEEGRTILGLIQQHGEPDYAEADVEAKRKHGATARLYSEGDDLDLAEANAGTQWLVVAAK